MGTSTATARPSSGLCRTAPPAATRGRSSSTDGQEVNPEPPKPCWPPHSDEGALSELYAAFFAGADQFIRNSPDSLAIGGGGETFGLWLDKAFATGTTGAPPPWHATAMPHRR